MEERPTTLLEALLERIRPVETAAGLIVDILLTLVVIVVGLTVARMLKQRLVRAISRTQATGNLAVLLGNVLFIGGVILTALLAMRINGFDATAALAVLGFGTVAIGLALQDVLKNLLAGVYLLLEQPFRIGDTIVVDGREGTVESIDVRSTILRMPDGTQALVPNAIVFATTVLNRTAYPARRVSIRMAGLTEPLDVINTRVVEALRDHPDLTHTPGPKVHTEAVADGKLTVLIDLWRKADRQLPPEVLLRLEELFPGASVTLVPLP